MKNIFKWIIYLLIVWLVFTVFYSADISYYTGGLLGAIILGGIVGVLYYYFFVKSKKKPEPEPEPEPEPKYEKKPNWIFRIIFFYIISLIVIVLLDLHETEWAQMYVEPMKFAVDFIKVVIEYVK